MAFDPQKAFLGDMMQMRDSWQGWADRQVEKQRVKEEQDNVVEMAGQRKRGYQGTDQSQQRRMLLGMPTSSNLSKRSLLGM